MSIIIKQTTRHHFAGKPIRYHVCLDKAFDAWASDCGWEPQSLKQASEWAIRTSHHEATFEHGSHGKHDNHPDVFTLAISSVQVFYTVEPFGVMVRGYGWQIDHEPYDDFDGGGFYGEASW